MRSASTSGSRAARATAIRVARGELIVDLSDGRTLAVPIDWFPRLFQASAKERSNWRLIGSGIGIHWPDLDEDVSVAGLLAGRRSGESQASLARWMSKRSRRPKSGAHVETRRRSRRS